MHTGLRFLNGESPLAVIMTMHSTQGDEGHTTSLTYDGGDLVTLTDPLNRSINRFIDAIGRLSTVTDPLGNRNIFNYDALKRLIQSTDALGNSTASTYDANNNRLSFTDPRGGTTSWTYDSLNRALTRTDALNQVESYAYDLAGNLVRFTDRKGQVTGYQYDLLNRRTFAGFGASVANPTAYTSTIAYIYDAASRITQIVDSANGTITRSYDGLDRLTSETTPQGTVSYTYDAAGRRTQTTAPGQPVTTYAYDNANRLTGITQGSQTVGFGYDNADRRTSLTLPNGVSVASGFDAAGQLTSLVYGNGGATLGDLSYTYDAAGKRVRQGGSFARINLPASISGAISYDAANRLTTWDGSAIAYDANGNMTTALGQAYSWNERNQLAASSGSATGTYAYDALSRRQVRTVNGTTTKFLYDGQQPIQELTGSNTLSASLLTGGIDEIFSRTEAGVTQSFLTDALSSTLRLTDATGAKVVDYSYEAYGKATNDNAASTNTFQYTGRENDGTGFQFNRARYYDPRLERFISEDPIGLAGGYNQYSYVGGNPISRIDPYGLRDVDVYIWRAEGTSVEHVMVTEAGSTQVILSQFPGNGYPLGPNETKSFADTMTAEGRPASEVWRINVPNDASFDAAAARERGLKLWSWNPSNDSTQCSIAASRTLKAGGVGLNTMTTGTLMPGFFANGLQSTPGVGVRLP